MSKSDVESFPIAPPIEPMLAKLADGLPEDGDFLFEPKWDGFRSIVFRGPSEVFIQSQTCDHSTDTSRSCTRRSSRNCQRDA